VPGSIRNFGGRGSLRSFLLGVAANLARRHTRSASRRRHALAQLSVNAQVANAAGAEHAIHARARALYRALDSLPLAQRTAFVLCEVEERNALEVADILGVPETTVRTRCFHARKKLLRSLAGTELTP
jgi:RNA polymerase sigma-70 factor (ECF subfamily)